jgi:hypothetical protein
MIKNQRFIENFLKNHLEDQFKITFEVISNEKTKRITSKGLTGQNYLDLVNANIDPFEETMAVIKAEIIISELPEEEHLNFYKK